MPRRSQTKKKDGGSTGSGGGDSGGGSNSTRRSQQGSAAEVSEASSARSMVANNNNAASGLAAAGNQNVAAHVRERQRAVAEREAARLALPERRVKKVLAHSSKSARSSTPFGHRHVQLHRDGDKTLPEDSGWCGPFSVARQMIAAREEAKRKRLEEQELDAEEAGDGSHPLDKIMEEFAHEQKKKIHPSMRWKSNLLKDGNNDSIPTNMYAKRQKLANVSALRSNRVPTLTQLCVNFVVDNFDYVESLGDVDNDVRLAISKELVARGKLDNKAFQALVAVVGHGNEDSQNPSLPVPLYDSGLPPVMPSTLETLEIVDCAGISHDCMAQTIEAVGGSLRYLLLTNAGRCFGTKTVKALLKEIKGVSGEVHYTPRAQLQCISVSGAYLLKDDDAAKLVTANAGTLQSVAFDCCPLLGPKFVQSIRGLHDHGSSSNKLLELELMNMTQFSAVDLTNLTKQSSQSLASVRSLTLQNISGLTDDMVASILSVVGSSLNSLNLSHNFDLSDALLSAIRQYNPSVKTLVLDGIKEVTAAGLESFFTPISGMSPPPKLRVLKLASVHHEAVTDEVMKLAFSTRVAENIDTNLAAVKTSQNTGMVQLDVSGSTLVTDSMLEALVETSAETLEEINVSYCPGISDFGLGYLVSKVGRQLQKVIVWGNAQLSEEFFGGHDRVGDLEIVGAWMKKSGISSLR